MNDIAQSAIYWRVTDKRLLLGGFAYFLLAKFGMALFSLQPSNITLLWLPSGIGLLMCMSAGKNALPAILLASFAANFAGMALPSFGLQIFHTMVAAFADATAAWLAAFMLRRHLPQGMARPFDLIPFAVFVCIIPTLVSAGILAGNLALGGYIPGVKILDFVVMLLVADSLGILLCYPLMDIWGKRLQLSSAEVLPWILLTAAVMAVVQFSFSFFPALIFLLPPVFLYMAFSGKRTGIPLTLALAVCLVVINASHGLGPFELADPVHGRAMLMFFLFSTVLTVTGILLQEKQLLAEQALIADQNVRLAKAKEAAEAANIAKSEFLAKISHEMRTPLHQIAGLADLLRREPLTPKQTDRLDKLNLACKNLNAIVETLLELTRLVANKFEKAEIPYDSHSVIAKAVHEIQAQADAKGVPVIIETDPMPSGLLADTTHIKMALFSYLSNAVRFTHSGSITIRSKIANEDHESVLMRFEVEDTGPGISPEDQKRLFNIFEQLDNSSTRRYGGLGAGLAITKQLAQLMGGDAGCESTQGVGSTFWFTARLRKA